MGDHKASRLGALLCAAFVKNKFFRDQETGEKTSEEYYVCPSSFTDDVSIDGIWDLSVVAQDFLDMLAKPQEDGVQ